MYIYPVKTNLNNPYDIYIIELQNQGDIFWQILYYFLIYKNVPLFSVVSLYGHKKQLPTRKIIKRSPTRFLLYLKKYKLYKYIPTYIPTK